MVRSCVTTLLGSVVVRVASLAALVIRGWWFGDLADHGFSGSVVEVGVHRMPSNASMTGVC
jgi:hypothetical protein